MNRYDLSIIDSNHTSEYCFVHFLQSGELYSLIQIGHHITEPGYGYGPAMRDHYLLHLVRRGRGIVRANDMEYEIEAGSIFAIFPNQITYYESSVEDPWEYYYIGFNGKLAPGIMHRIGFERDQSIVVHMKQPDSVFETMQSIHDVMGSREQIEANVLYILGQSLNMLHTISHERQDAVHVKSRINQGQLGSETTRTLIAIIHFSLSQHISVSKLAERLNLNRSYMTALFKRDTGKSIQDYIADVRMGRAIILLQNPDLPINSVAFRCGFDDALYFSRVFKKRYGVSPREWRSQYNGRKR